MGEDRMDLFEVDGGLTIEGRKYMESIMDLVEMTGLQGLEDFDAATLFKLMARWRRNADVAERLFVCGLTLFEAETGESVVVDAGEEG